MSKRKPAPMSEREYRDKLNNIVRNKDGTVYSRNGVVVQPPDDTMLLDDDEMGINRPQN
jgi:hypothetical protein